MNSTLLCPKLASDNALKWYSFLYNKAQGLISKFHFQVEKVEAPFDKEKEQRRNFVFVEFKNEESVDKVLNHTSENPDFKHSLGNDEV